MVGAFLLVCRFHAQSIGHTQITQIATRRVLAILHGRLVARDVSRQGVHVFRSVVCVAGGGHLDGDVTWTDRFSMAFESEWTETEEKIRRIARSNQRGYSHPLRLGSRLRLPYFRHSACGRQVNGTFDMGPGRL